MPDEDEGAGNDERVHAMMEVRNISIRQQWIVQLRILALHLHSLPCYRVVQTSLRKNTHSTGKKTPLPIPLKFDATAGRFDAVQIYYFTTRAPLLTGYMNRHTHMSHICSK